MLAMVMAVRQLLELSVASFGLSLQEQRTSRKKRGNMVRMVCFIAFLRQKCRINIELARTIGRIFGLLSSCLRRIRNASSPYFLRAKVPLFGESTEKVRRRHASDRDSGVVQPSVKAMKNRDLTLKISRHILYCFRFELSLHSENTFKS